MRFEIDANIATTLLVGAIVLGAMQMSISAWFDRMDAWFDRLDCRFEHLEAESTTWPPASPAWEGLIQGFHAASAAEDAAVSEEPG